MLVVTVFCKPIFSPLRWSHPGFKLFVGEETEKAVKGGKIQMGGKSEQDSSSFYGVLLAPVVFEEDFSFPFGANISLFFESEH